MIWHKTDAADVRLERAASLSVCTRWKAGSQGASPVEIMNIKSCIIDSQVNLFILLQKSEM